jgi:hypothetical protein
MPQTSCTGLIGIAAMGMILPGLSLTRMQDWPRNDDRAALKPELTIAFRSSRLTHANAKSDCDSVLFSARGIVTQMIYTGPDRYHKTVLHDTETSSL